MLQQVVFQVARSTCEAAGGQPEVGSASSFFSFASPPMPLVQDWMLASLIPSVLNVGLPLPLAFLLAAPGVIDAIDRRLPHYLVWADITPFTADNASSEASKPTKRLPRWKQAAFILMNAGGAALCAVAAADRLCREPTMSGGSLSDSWRWFSAAEAAILTLVWAFLATHGALRPSPTPVYPTLAIHLFLLLSTLFSAALAYLRSQPMTTHTALALGLLLSLLALHLSLPVNIIPDDSFGHPAGIGGRSPEEEASLWSWITYGFMQPLFDLGWGKKLDDHEVWRISPLKASGLSRTRFTAYRARHPDRGLFASIVLLNCRGLLGDLLCSLFCIGLAYTSPFCMKRVLDAIERPSPLAVREAYVFAAVAMAASILKAVFSGFSRRSGSGAEIRTRGALMSAIYYKALKRQDHSGVVSARPEAGDAKKETVPRPTGADIGKIVSLMSNDVVRISNRITNASDLYSPPIEVIVASVFLYQLLGLSAFAGALGLLVLLPFNSYLRKRAVQINKRNVEARDARMTIMNELVLSIKPLKFFAWEERWSKRASAARDSEMKQILAGRTNAVLFNIVWGLAPLVITLLSFWSFVTFGQGQLTVSTAFTSLSLYSMLAGPLSAIPAQLVVWAQSRLSLDRLEAFLREPEVPDYVSTLSPRPTTDADRTLGIKKGLFRWIANVDNVPDDSTFLLGPVDVSFPTGKLTVLTGPVGAGKTALLLALLGELKCIEGCVQLPKSGRALDDGLVEKIAYCAQTPFLQHRSIRDNILYGEHFDKNRYDAVIFACALRHDFASLEDGDATQTGEKGVVLSGGQKSRLAVARALYSRAAVCLLDDPLAALDSTTSRHLIQHGLTGPLMKGRTVVIASHHLDLLLPRANYVVKLESGGITIQGSVESLRASGDLPLLVPADEDITPIPVELESETARDEACDHLVKDASDSSSRSITARTLIEKEARSDKNVAADVYLTYIRASGTALWAVIALLLVFHQGVSQLSRYWLKIWGEAYAFESDGYMLYGVRLPSAKERPLFYLAIYATISLAVLIVATLQISASYLAAYGAAVSLHDRLLLRVTRATMRTFDRVPAGRILARFSADVASLDGNLAITLRTTLAWTASAIVSVCVILAVEPYFALPALLLALAYGRISLVYTRTSRDLRRMMSNARSPLFSDFGEILDGIVTCRAFSSEGRFLRDFEENVDLLLAKIYFNWASNRWLLLQFDGLSALAVYCSMVFAIQFSASSGSSAMAILSTQSFVSAIYWLCRNITNLELAFNAVERISEYLLLPQEAPGVLQIRPPAAWPAPARDKPMVEVKDLVVRYDPALPDVLKGITFSIAPGEKIGVIGRTGSGKSTLALSLLRAFEPASGSIFIDGINTQSIGVHDLRSKLTFVPQDPAIFKGDIRSNLDPFGDHTDFELLDMLQRVHLLPSQSTLASSAASLYSVEGALAPIDSSSTLVPSSSRPASCAPSKSGKSDLHLDTPVSAGGANLSGGQRQLLALARALLAGNQIIILDEASSAIDHQTDDLIQKTLREETTGATVITIAHRLSTIIDADRLLVLQDGQVAEFDSPAALLALEGGVLRGMALEAGSLDQLIEIHRRFWNERDSP